ncbi:MAG: DUF58 domain-containing protein [Actinomycetaceae bacterium]|nr:DUF58 domain-containing protein [Actinomycetaceae bacterium]
MSISWRVPVLLLLGVVPVIFWPHPTTVGKWLVVVLAVVLVDLLAAPSPRKLRITRDAVAPVRVGEQSESVLRITNPGRRMKADVRDAWQPSAGANENRHRIVLVRDQETPVSTTLNPTRRGNLRASSVTVRAWGPLGLAARQTTFELDGDLRSLPEFPARKHLPAALAKLQFVEGQALARQRGQGTEFDSLREWVDGDDVRSIDWRATARRSEDIIVKTWRPERDRHVVMVLDTSRVSAVRLGDVTRLDAQMDAALLLSALCAKAGDSVSMIAGDLDVTARVVKPGPRDVLREMSHAMTPLDANFVEADWSSLGAAVTQFGKKVSLVVVFTPVNPTVLSESLLPVLVSLAKRQHIVLAHALDPDAHELAQGRDSIEDVYLAAAAEYSRERTADAVRGLRSAGITTIQETPEDLPMAVVDHYLNLKSQGLL